MDRNFAAVEFAKTIRARADFRDLIVDLEGRQLACTCTLNRRCHGDVLVRLFHEVRKDSLLQGVRKPVSDKEAWEEAKRQSDSWAQPRAKRDVLNRREPTRVMGVGPPYRGWPWPKPAVVFGRGRVLLSGPLASGTEVPDVRD